MINPTRRRLARLVLPVLLLFFVTIGIALYQTVSQVNALDAQRARAAMAVALDGLMASLADYAHDNAAWDDAARAVYAPAPDTRFIATTWGEATGEHVYADAFMIVDASGAVRSAYRDGLATAPALSPELRRTLHVLRTRALHSGQGAAALVRRDGWITLVGVAPVRPTSRALDGLVPAAGPSIIAFQRDLTARDAARIGTSLQLPGVSFAARPHGATSAPVRDVEGRVIAGVTWAPTYTGSIALGRALPVILIAGVLYLIAAGFAFNRGYASLRQLGWQAMADSLSKLPNRRALRWEMVRRADMKADIGLAIVDLDGFKRVNDSFGHETGDQLIRAVALILKQAAGNEAMAVRLSGDEFALLAHGPDAHDTIERQLGSDGAYAPIPDVAAKAAENIARLAALMHLLEHGPVGTIGRGCVDSATRLVLWHLQEANRLLGDLDAPPALSAAIRFDAWLRSEAQRTGDGRIPTTRVYRFGPGCVRDNKDMKEGGSRAEDGGFAPLA